MSVQHVYEVVCDNCGEADYLHGIQNKKELQTELEARGYLVTYQMKTILCEDCRND